MIVIFFTEISMIFSMPNKDTSGSGNAAVNRPQTITIIDSTRNLDTTYIDNKADTLKQQIDTMPDTLIADSSERIYYVSSINGNDKYDGLAPRRALKTPAIATKKVFESNQDCTILFERGSLFRGNFGLLQRNGKHYGYGAYGVGPKPVFCGSLLNYADSPWISQTSRSNVWLCNTEISNDAGIVVFNEGQNVGIKKFKLTELQNNFDFYYDRSAKKVYLYYTSNPASSFDSIEIGQAWLESPMTTDELSSILSIPNSYKNINIENLSFQYGGGHGISGDNLSNIIIRGCEFNWIGGGVQNRDFSSDARYGNAVEFWNSCDNILVENCYFNQIFDAAITHQGDKSSNINNNVTYRNNLMEYCNYSIEYFQRKPEALMSNILVEGNIMRFAGYGWSSQRSDTGYAAHIQSWGHNNRTSNFIIKNNILDTSLNNLFDIRINLSLTGTALPVLSDNIYSQTYGGLGGLWGSNLANKSTIIKFTQNDLETVDSNPLILLSKFVSEFRN